MNYTIIHKKRNKFQYNLVLSKETNLGNAGPLIKEKHNLDKENRLVTGDSSNSAVLHRIIIIININTSGKRSIDQQIDMKPV